LQRESILYEFYLKVGIVLIWAKFLTANVARLGGIGLAIAVIEILFSIAFVSFFSPWFKLPEKLKSLSRCEWASGERRQPMAQRARSTQKKKKLDMR
jgi:hypothetical protein